MSDETRNDRYLFEMLIRQLEHEDTLLVARTGWLLTAQSFLLAGFFTIDPTKIQSFNIIKIDYFLMVAIFGLISSIFILSAVLAAVKIYIELRTDLFELLIYNSLLPARKLLRYGIGSGLLCPILLSIAILFMWSLLALKSWVAATFMAFSAALFSIYIVGIAHRLSHGRARRMIGLCLPAGLGALVVALSWSSIHPPIILPH